MDQWTPRVKARAELAEMLRDRYLARAEAAGLTRKELDEISRHGRKAEKADEDQKTELGLIAAERGAQKDLKDSVFAREDALRDRLPLVVGELWDCNERDMARWLTSVSYARYRFRELPQPEASDATSEAGTPKPEVLRAVERVPRADVATRARGIAAFCDALLEPGFEAITRRLAARSFPPEDLRALSADARRLYELGRNVSRAAEATAIEAEAVKAQRVIWKRARRAIRKAVQGVPELEKKFAEC